MSSPSPTPFVDENNFSPLDNVRNATIVFLVGVALVLSLLVLMTAVVLAERCYGFCFGFPETGSMDHGPVSRKANLWGLSQAERVRILPLLFEKTSFLWNMEQEWTSTSNTTTINYDPIELQTPAAATLQVESSTYTKVVSLEDDDDEDRACCSICLTAFEPGVSVMTGTSCAHVFHSSCCMEWLSQHDHCPYCRQEFMTAQELRQAAIAVLGSQRVHQLGLPGVQGTLRTRATQSLELPTMRPGQEGTSTNEEAAGGLQEPNVVDVEAGAAETVGEIV
jgi:hypothetical protein